MRLQIALFLCLSLTAITLSSQDPAGATLDANRVKAQFNSNGALFTDLQKGQFVAPYVPGQPEISLLRAGGIWLAGKNTENQIAGALQMVNTGGVKDYLPGLLDASGQPYPGGALTGIYRVGSAEIEAHQADFADNGIIDNPLPAVFGWPAQGNPFFGLYHSGQVIPFAQEGLAGFADRDGDGIYNPAQGDFPALDIQNCPAGRVPTQMIWFVYHDNTPHTQSGFAHLNMELQCLAFAFDCTEDSPLNNTVFVRHKLIYKGVVQVDDFHIGVYNCFTTGNTFDDYFGCDSTRALVFGYNSDAFDENGYGAHIPAMGVKVLGRPTENNGQPIPFARVFNFFPGELVPTYYQYFRMSRQYLKNIPNNFTYAGNPNDPNADSEWSAATKPGVRNVTASFGPVTLMPGAVIELNTGYFFTQEPGNTPLQNVQAMYSRADAIQAFFDNCFSPSDQIVCSPVTDAHDLPAAAVIKIFPNPAGQLLTIASGNAGITRVQLTDMTGRTAYRQFMAGTVPQVKIPVSQLPPGLYFAEIWLEGGARGWERVVVSR